MGSGTSSLCSCLADDVRPSSRAKSRTRKAPRASESPDTRVQRTPQRSVPPPAPQPQQLLQPQQSNVERPPQSATPPSVSVTPPRELFEPEPIERLEDLPAEALPSVSFSTDGGPTVSAEGARGGPSPVTSPTRRSIMAMRDRSGTNEGSGVSEKGRGTSSPSLLTIHTATSSPRDIAANPLALQLGASGSQRSQQSLRNNEPHTTAIAYKASKDGRTHGQDGDESAEPKRHSDSILSTVTTSRTQSVNLDADSLRQGSSQRHRWAASLSASGPQNSDDALRTCSKARGLTENGGNGSGVKFRQSSSVPETTTYLSATELAIWEPLQLDLACSHRSQLAVRKVTTPVEQSLNSSTLPTAVSHRLDQLCDVVRR